MAEKKHTASETQEIISEIMAKTATKEMKTLETLFTGQAL